jgi:uncharacterized LabA/DUF88 family protein
MAGVARLFIDYWNFQLNWNERADAARCDWLALPGRVIEAIEAALQVSPLEYGGASIYASVEPSNENLVSWLVSFLDRQPGFRVRTVRMVRRQRSQRCSSCGVEVTECPECGEPYAMAIAKGLTSRLVLDVLELVNAGACDVPVIVTSDTELVPVVEHLLDRGVRVVHAGWRDVGGELARAAWASLELEPLMPKIVRD